MCSADTAGQRLCSGAEPRETIGAHGRPRSGPRPGHGAALPGWVSVPVGERVGHQHCPGSSSSELWLHPSGRRSSVRGHRGFQVCGWGQPGKWLGAAWEMDGPSCRTSQSLGSRGPPRTSRRPRGSCPVPSICGAPGGLWTPRPQAICKDLVLSGAHTQSRGAVGSGGHCSCQDGQKAFRTSEGSQ